MNVPSGPKNPIRCTDGEVAGEPSSSLISDEATQWHRHSPRRPSVHPPRAASRKTFVSAAGAAPARRASTVPSVSSSTMYGNDVPPYALNAVTTSSSAIVGHGQAMAVDQVETVGRGQALAQRLEAAADQDVGELGVAAVVGDPAHVVVIDFKVSNRFASKVVKPPLQVSFFVGVVLGRIVGTEIAVGSYISHVGPTNFGASHVGIS